MLSKKNLRALTFTNLAVNKLILKFGGFYTGFCMFLDVPQERGLEEADFRFGDPNYCFFPLFPFLEPLKLSHACIVYSVMWMGKFLYTFLPCLRHFHIFLCW